MKNIFQKKILVGTLILVGCLSAFLFFSNTVRAGTDSSGLGGTQTGSAQTDGSSGLGGTQQGTSGQDKKQITNSTSDSDNTFTLTNPLKVNSIGELIMNFVEIFSYIVVLLAVLALIYVGFQYIMASASGNTGKLTELHSWLLWIVVGVAVVIGARVIVQIVINTISATGTVDQSIIDTASKALQKK